MSVRTDIHRPSVINPEDYVYVATKYDGVGTVGRQVTLGAQRVIGEHMARTGGKYSLHDHAGTCMVCGAHAAYLAVFYHPSTNTYICTGEDCADKMSMTGGEFRALRKAIRAGEEAATGKARALKQLTAQGLAAAWPVYEQKIHARRDLQIIRDIVGALVRYGNLTDKQWPLLRRLVEAMDGEEQRLRDLAAQREAEKAASQYVGSIGDRITIEGTIVFRTSYETRYGVTHVTGIKDGAGNVYIQKGVFIGEKGDSVSLKATVKDHSEREGVKQTIISRPKEI